MFIDFISFFLFGEYSKRINEIISAAETRPLTTQRSDRLLDAARAACGLFQTLKLSLFKRQGAPPLCCCRSANYAYKYLNIPNRFLAHVTQTKHGGIIKCLKQYLFCCYIVSRKKKTSLQYS